MCIRDSLINMLEQCGATGFDDESLTIQVPSRFAYNYLVKQRELIERYLEEISFMPMVLNVVVAEGGAPSETQTPTAAATPTVPVTAAAASLAPAGDGLPQRAAEVPTSFAEAPASPITPAEPVTASEPTVTAPAKPEPASKSGVTVRNTVSPEAFRKMMDEMRSQDPTGKRQNVTAPQQPAATHAPVAAAPAATPEPDAAALDINAKYTFASFVAGDENRHAFNSAMRFAAYAEEPQQCPSLFIYGNSGLGKTHLLLSLIHI